MRSPPCVLSSLLLFAHTDGRLIPGVMRFGLAFHEPGKDGCSADVVRETPGRPPGRHSGVFDNVAVNGIKDAMAGQRHNDDPRVRLEPGNGRSRGMNGKFLNFNRGKKSIAIDLKQPAGIAALKRLAATVDVFVTNIRPDAQARLGVDADALRTAAPRLIHCSITGFGSGGPYAGRAAYDTVAPYSSGSHLLTFQSEADDAVIRAAFGDNYARLAEVKRKYDPTNFFALNANIRPEESVLRRSGT